MARGRHASYKVVVATPTPPPPQSLVPPVHHLSPGRETPEPGTSLIDFTLQRPKLLTPMEIRSRIMAAMAKRHYDPIIELIDMVTRRNDNGDFFYPPDFRKDIHLQLAQFIAPRLKASEITVEGDLSLSIEVTHFGNAPGPRQVGEQVAGAIGRLALTLPPAAGGGSS